MKRRDLYVTVEQEYGLPATLSSWAQNGGKRRSLLDGAFLVAPIVEPAIDRRAWSIVIRGILRKSLADAREEADPLARFHSARAKLQDRFKLEGDLQDFYNPFNICIHKVVTRGLGVPVSLGVVWITLGRLCGLDVRGTGMPGHFMMRFSHEGKTWFVDPFHPERSYDASGCRELFSTVMKAGGAEFSEHWLEPVDDVDIIVRMLSLGLEVLSASGDFGRALMTTSALLELEPTQPRHFQRRAALFEEMGDWHGATDAWESCLYAARSDALRELAAQRLQKSALWTHGYH